MPDPDGLAWSLYDLGHLAFVRGELAQANPLLAESLALFRDQGNEYGCQRALISLGHWLEARARQSAGSAIRELLNLAPAVALRLEISGRETGAGGASGDHREVPVAELTIGPVAPAKHSRCSRL